MTVIKVILVDEDDRPVGEMEKLEAHEKGLLHRAVTVYVFNSRHELLLQQRAADKYHCGGLWSNTCCGHPYPGEDTLAAAQRRLEEEMGLSCRLHKGFKLKYRLVVNQGLVEHEYGHVFYAISDQLPVLNPHEAQAFCYASQRQTQARMLRDPEHFTPWFRHTFARAIKEFNL
ncbi:isopentenyl-diphosphate Delta-isomerase|uniref:isopentenyl-diphosphate Delta-isomerase n=1 Tax=Pseudomonas sp. SbOxS1 TaxID=2723884 RepID=UPI0015D2D552|nr:isopentenyl-diphosphate Delta-isomerase [Pseudomonas sp. SbOxS1]NYU01101.1 isopentenyl-diphosphate Delta-isomerase [Pseudomonas sp. SbOxS1]